MEGMLKTYNNSAILNIAQIEEIKINFNCLSAKMKNNFIEEHILYKDESRDEQFFRELLGYLFQVLSQMKNNAFIDMQEIVQQFLQHVYKQEKLQDKCINSTGKGSKSNTAGRL